MALPPRPILESPLAFSDGQLKTRAAVVGVYAPPCVALVSPGWPPANSANGIVTYCRLMRDGLRSIGVRCSILAGARNTGGEPGVVAVARAQTRVARAARRVVCAVTGRDGTYADALGVAASRLARDGLCDLVEMEESLGRARRVVERSRLPVVVRLHGPWVVVGRAIGARADQAFIRRVEEEGAGLRVAAGVSAPSWDVLVRVRAHYGLSLADAEVLPNPAPVTGEAERWRWADSTAGRVLFVGRFDRCKGADVLLDAFAQVARRERAAGLTFVGPDRGLTDDADRRWGIQEYITERLGAVRERVEWLGQRSAEEIRHLRRRAAVTVVCSRYENFPMVALEAISMGCPLVATAVGGLKEIVQDGRNGLLCRAGDPGDLAEKILTLLCDRPLAERLGRQAAVDCEERYHPEVVARQTLAFYSRVLERAKRQ